MSPRTAELMTAELMVFKLGTLARLGLLGLGRRGARDLNEFALALFGGNHCLGGLGSAKGPLLPSRAT